MTNQDLKYLVQIAEKFLNCNLTNQSNLNVSFKAMDPRVGGYFNLLNQNYTEMVFNDKYNKTIFSYSEFRKFLGIVIHECRHYYQLCLTSNGNFMMEFVQRGYSTLEIDDWISYEMEQDAEALRLIFITKVLKFSKASKLLKTNKVRLKYRLKIYKLMRQNMSKVDMEGALSILMDIKKNTNIICQ